MNAKIIYGNCESKLNARKRRRMKRAAEQDEGPHIQKIDKVEKAIRFANEERCKSNSVKERRKGATKWYQENESGNYFHATQPRQLGEIPLDKVRYH
ncbi:hypothetical protein B7654_003814 [Escherichia coli]|uniref:hypothetical protein n=1 Tax=Escherichia coli TaxID=562 RepID=UPI000BBB792E|nr:hypothetical protein [Escherichia coli]EKF4266798.1 hypothetical protein [Escherichia coli O113]ELP2939280.1 hypothetical protein [Escherichia coli O83]MEE1486459.1 hypothetical protein [Shigella flexneri]EED0293309.1 hypothetical protein [Escherichia coli]EET7202612.1 hypothetical protein [Escherichia coli]